MKKMNQRKLGKKGFTLIEVVLVLAIGGLIFLLAFLAFQQATQNRRDTQRRSDAGQVISEIENALGDGNGSTFASSDDLGDFVEAYLSGESNASGGTFERNNIEYTIVYNDELPDGTATSNTAQMAVSRNARCVGNSMNTGAGNGNGDYAVLVRLEKGIACRDNQ